MRACGRCVTVAWRWLRRSLWRRAQLPLQPARDAGQSITAAFEGWYQNADGTYTLLVGYFNRNVKQTLDIPVGPNNRIEPGGPDQGQPTHFLPRRQWGVFTIKVPKDFGDKRLTWTIIANGQTTSMPVGVIKGYQVEPFKEVAQGNEPPKIQFDAKGPASSRVRRSAIAATLTGTVGQPRDPQRDRHRRRRTTIPTLSPIQLKQPPITVFVEQVSAGPATSRLRMPGRRVEKDGKVTTTATFSQPGEYIVRRAGQRSIGRGRRRLPVLLDQHARQGHNHRRARSRRLGKVASWYTNVAARPRLQPSAYNPEVAVLLLSTYDLGRQPFGLASPAAWLRGAGLQVVTCDLSRERLDEARRSRAPRSSPSTCRCTRRRGWRCPVLDRVRALEPRRHARAPTASTRR